MKNRGIRKAIESGYTFVEFMVVMAIFIILTTSGVWAFLSARSSKTLSTATDQMVARIAEAQNNALNDKNGSDYGISFSNSSYYIFKGDSLNLSDPTSFTQYSLPNGYTATTTSAWSGIYFTRLTGVPSQAATTSISSLTDPTQYQRIIIGAGGDVTVLK